MDNVKGTLLVPLSEPHHSGELPTATVLEGCFFVMSKTILAEVDGFTPLIDDLVKEFGPMRAAVFGRVWRYCQMEDRVCNAAIEKIADGLGISRMTVIRHMESLCADGYLEDLTPGMRNSPHSYRDTGKAGIKVSLSAIPKSDSESNKKLQRAIPKSDLKIVSKKEKYISKYPNRSEGSKAIIRAYVDLLGYDPGEAANGEIESAEWLAEHGYTPEQLAETYKAMKADSFWKGQRIKIKHLKERVPEMVRDARPAPASEIRYG